MSVSLEFMTNSLISLKNLIVNIYKHIYTYGWIYTLLYVDLVSQSRNERFIIFVYRFWPKHKLVDHWQTFYNISYVYLFIQVNALAPTTFPLLFSSRPDFIVVFIHGCMIIDRAKSLRFLIHPVYYELWSDYASIFIFRNNLNCQQWSFFFMLHITLLLNCFYIFKKRITEIIIFLMVCSSMPVGCIRRCIIIV